MVTAFAIAMTFALGLMTASIATATESLKVATFVLSMPKMTATAMAFVSPKTAAPDLTMPTMRTVMVNRMDAMPARKMRQTIAMRTVFATATTFALGLMTASTAMVTESPTVVTNAKAARIKMKMGNRTIVTRVRSTRLTIATAMAAVTVLIYAQTLTMPWMRTATGSLMVATLAQPTIPTIATATVFVKVQIYAQEAMMGSTLTATALRMDVTHVL